MIALGVSSHFSMVKGFSLNQSVIKRLLYPICSDRVQRFDISLDLPQAAVDAQFGTGYVAGVIAQQEQGGRSHF